MVCMSGSSVTSVSPSMKSTSAAARATDFCGS